jgi:hypothetical protein
LGAVAVVWAAAGMAAASSRRAIRSGETVMSAPGRVEKGLEVSSRVWKCREGSEWV